MKLVHSFKQNVNKVGKSFQQNDLSVQIKCDIYSDFSSPIKTWPASLLGDWKILVFDERNGQFCFNSKLY